MTPNPFQPAPSGNPQTTAAGVIAIAMGALTMFCQVWNLAHGGAMDPTGTLAGAGMIGSGVGLVKAKDANK